MESLSIIGYTKDLRTNTNVLYAQISINDYIKLVGEDFDRFEIQRTRVNHSAYKRMRTDIINGALLPTITLAINPEVAKKYIDLVEEQNEEDLKALLVDSEQIYILDGLQRTYIINDIKSEGINFRDNQKLLLEFWFENDIKHLIYRLIVLNAGQKPMSMRHQVELLFMTMQQKLQSEIADLEIYSERDETKRNKAKKLPFDRLVTAYYSFITKSTEVKRDNIIVQQMNEQTVMDSNEEDLANTFNLFINYLQHYCDMDEEVFRIYSSFQDGGERAVKNWLADENVINSFFAALSSFGNDDRKKERIEVALDKLVIKLKESKNGDDPLDLKQLSIVRSGINPKKINVGFETRKILMNGFKEFFREEGDITFEECWKLGAS